MRTTLPSLWRRGLCLVLAACYLACLGAAALTAAPDVAAEGSIASIALLPKAENPHLSPDDPGLAAPSPEPSKKNLHSWNGLFPLLILILWPHLFQPVRLSPHPARLPRASLEIRGFLPLPASPPVA